MKKPKRPFFVKKQGFTLIELIITLAIIAIVATVLIVSFTSARQRSNDAKRRGDLEAIKGALALFYADNGFYPSSNGGALQVRLDVINQITNCTGVPAPCPPPKVYLNDIQKSYSNPVKVIVGGEDSHHYCYMGQASSGSLINAAGNDCDNTTNRCNHYRLFAYLDQPPSATIYACNDGSTPHAGYLNYMVEP